MSTTIQVSDATVMVLRRIRQQFNASSYDEAIQHVLRDARRQRSLYGFLGKNISKKQILHGLRDKFDKY